MTRVVFVYGNEPYDVYIGRGKDPQTGKYHGTILTGKSGDYGNAWSHKDGTLAQFHTETVEEAVEAFQRYCDQHPEVKERIKRELKDKTLACWCNSPKRKDTTKQPCHGDVLAAIADGRL